MKSTRPLLMVILSSLLAVAIPAESQDGETVVFDIEGMTCGSCADAITAALGELDGVAEAQTDFASATARVRFDPAKTSPDAMVAAVAEMGYGARPRAADADDESTLTASASTGASCAATADAAASRLTADELDRVAAYIADQVAKTGRTAFEDEEIEEATGVVLGDGDGPAVRQAVIEKLSASEAGQRRLAGSRCEAYEACSLYGDLSGANGDILAMYERERAEDGTAFDDFELPEFAAYDLAGREVSSRDLRGQPALLAFVAVHCRHSMDSLPILQQLTETYGPGGLRVVAVAINSGTVDDVNTWFPSFDPKYEVWVSSGDELGDRIGSHLVPTYLLVDAEGRITEKLVGYKQGPEVTERVLARLVASESGSPAATPGAL